MPYTKCRHEKTMECNWLLVCYTFTGNATSAIWTMHAMRYVPRKLKSACQSRPEESWKALNKLPVSTCNTTPAGNCPPVSPCRGLIVNNAKIQMSRATQDKVYSGSVLYRCCLLGGAVLNYELSECVQLQSQLFHLQRQKRRLRGTIRKSHVFLALSYSRDALFLIRLQCLVSFRLRRTAALLLQLPPLNCTRAPSK